MHTVAQPTQLVNGQTHQGQVHQTTRPQKSGFLPEAACSMTARLLVPTISREAILVTGRGHTGADAARNLLESCTALQAQASTPPPPLSREDRMGALLVKGLACAVRAGDAALATRLGNAAYLVLSGAVEPTERAQAMAVRSQSAPDTWYTVEAGTYCSCPDYGKHARADQPGYQCKHLLAVRLTARLAE